MKQVWLAITQYLTAERWLCCRTAQLLGCGLGKPAYREQVFSAWLPSGSGADYQAGLGSWWAARGQGRGDQEK